MLAQLLAQGRQQLFDGLGPLVEIAAGRLLRLFQAGIGQLEELRVVVLEGTARQLGELSHEEGADLVGRRLALGGVGPFLLEGGLQADDVRPGPVQGGLLLHPPGLQAGEQAARADATHRATPAPPAPPTTSPTTSATIMTSPFADTGRALRGALRGIRGA